MIKFLIVLLATFFVSIDAQLVTAGRCNKVNVVTSFDIPSYAGEWHEIYRYEHVNQLTGECSTATYTLINGTVQVFNTMVINGTRFTITGTARPAADANGGGKLEVNFPTVGNGFSDYLVLATNYDDYALVYGCTELPNNNKRVSSWVLSRTKTLSPLAVVAMNDALKTAGLFWETYRQTSQSETSCKFNNTVETLF